MTDKELRKLSRLELLELLLKEGTENEKLRAELDKLKSENCIKKTTERLEETAEHFNVSLQNIDSLVSVMQKYVSGNTTESSEPAESTITVKKKKMSVDADIYRRLMQFFFRNPAFLNHLTDELQKDITNRLTELQAKAKSTETN